MCERIGQIARDDVPIDSEIVKTFAAALAAINRVSVISTPRKEEEK